MQVVILKCFVCLLLLGMGIAGPAVASAQGVEDREEEMFGAPKANGDQDKQDEQNEQTQEEQFERRLQARSERALDMGGGLFSQLRYSVLAEGRPEEFPLSQPNFLDVYLDARPNKRLRVYADGRLSYTPTTSARLGVTGSGVTGSGVTDSRDAVTQTEAVLDELWVKFDIDRTVFVTAGRQHLRWGVGRFWFPNDFLFEQRRDPLALFDVRTGADIVKLHVPVESLGWNFYAVANLAGADSPEQVGAAARAEFLAGVTEFAFSAAAKRDDPLQLGLDISTGIGWFDLRAAVSVLRGVDEPFFRGASNLQNFDEITLQNVSELQIPERYSREDDWIPRALAGGEVGIPYGEDDTFYVGAEYFFNEAGYSNPELYPWLIFNGAFRPLYTGRHYASVYALLPAPGEWDDTSFSVSTLGNLSDRSFLSRLDYSVNVLTHMRVFVFGSATYGENGEFTQEIKVPAISEDVIGAAQTSGQFEAPAGVDLEGGFGGFSFPSTRASFGAGLSLEF
jgi:hypothetical protein